MTEAVMVGRVPRILVCLVVCVVGSFLLSPALSRAEEGPLGTPVVEADDVLVHVLETTCNTYVVTCRETKAFVVVDPGPGTTEAVAAWRAAGHEPVAVWITHEHGDHVSGLGALARTLDVPIVAHLKARKEIAHARENWKTWGMDGMSPIPPVLPNAVVADGNEVEVGDLSWKVLHVPGHSKGSIAYLLDDRVLLAGDVLFRGSVGRTDLDTSDHDVFKKSLSEKLWDLPDAVVVLPGHMETTTIGAEKTSNWLFQDYVRAARGESPIARPWMGIRIDQTHTTGGIAIESVEKASPSAKAGLGAGDVLLVFDGVVLNTPQDLVGAIRRRAVGDTVKVRVLTPDGERTLDFTFGARPPR